MAKKATDDPFLAELRSVMKEGLANVETAIKEREKLESERKARIDAVRDLILPKLDAIRESMKDQTFLGENPMDIQDNGREIVLAMPRLSEVNHIDLVYTLEIKDDIVLLKSFKRMGDGQLEQSGFADHDHDDYVKRSLVGFMKAWFGRRVSDELDRERELRLVVKTRAR